MNNYNERNYGVDLARLFFMFLICLQHTVYQGGVLDNTFLDDKSIYNVLYAITMIGVDGFALISGYVAQNKSQRYEKIVSMWFQVFFYSLGLPLGINILRLIIGTEAFNINEIVKGLFPVLNHTYWYYDAYLILFFFMPLINKALMDLDDKKSRKTLFVLFILMILMWKNNEAGSHNFLSTGRSAFWLIILYSVGILIKRANLFNNVKTWVLIALFSLSIVFSYFYVKGDSQLISNIDPTIWLASIFIIVIFSRIKPNKKIISFLSPLSFGVYLFHENYYYKYYFLSERYLEATNLLTIGGFMSIIVFAALTFVLGLFVDFVRKTLFNVLNIDKLSKNIVIKINAVLDRIVAL